MDSEWVCDQSRLYLVEPLRHYYRERQIAAFVGGNSFVYYPPHAHSVGPDFYVVRGGNQGRQTKWVPWEEGGLLPTTIIEFISDSTEPQDRGEKFCIYRDIFKTEDYFLIDPETLHIESYHLENGHYVAIAPNPDGWFFVGSLGLFLGVSGSWIRLRTVEGELLMTGRESAQAERKRAEAERRRANLAKADVQIAKAERQKAEAEMQKAEAERQRAEAEQQKAEAERQRADKAEAELQALKEQLKRLKG